MTGANWAIIVVGLISVLGAYVSGRAARSAAKFNADASTASSKAQAETEAYHRARKMDIETIERQNKEIEEIRKNNQDLRHKVRTLIADNGRLREDNNRKQEEIDSLLRRVDRLERQVGETHG